MEVDIIELDGKEYIEIDKIKGYKYTYVFLSNINTMTLLKINLSLNTL